MLLLLLSLLSPLHSFFSSYGSSSLKEEGIVGGGG